MKMMKISSKLKSAFSFNNNVKNGSNKFCIPRQFRQDKIIFIHIPKCAGSAFLDSYIGFQLGHASASDYYKLDRSLFLASFVFSFVRHPVCRFISAYNFLQKTTLWSYVPEIRNKINLYGSSVDQVAKTISKTSELLTLPWFKPQHTFLEIGGKVAASRVFKTETFMEDIKILQELLKIQLRPQATVNRSSSTTLNFSEVLHADSIKNLESIYERDITLFGYY
ncbi:sulfotransferase family 2 domain-containing protein [Leptolyngbya sp. CCNP1308]|uniref:sulfotransferase family 2 domain-containing protein n=1 Tax=Leptolyngbya sp. CCNP1308 TaxID=3110255 RepID=UPI002B21D177|nr:sulfotransferase family 2 domain-containing protein [Leptolyngbya sp. CCNP1308]MEA5452270.1 sulfotransferase family 2 domain-containing protein [Leptolyngbya sp. CCNP1308]